MSACIFCQIAHGEVPTKKIWETDDVMFFYDHAPKVKVHVIGIIKQHVPSLDEASAAAPVVAALLAAIPHVVREAGIDPEHGYRVVTNIGPHGGQEIPHLHFHILGGEPVGRLVSR